MSSANVGRGTRVWISSQVLVAALLALVSVLALNWLIGRPGWRFRIDLTQKGLNTLSTAVYGAFDRLEEPVTVDIFFRAEEGGLAAVAATVMERTRFMLSLLEQERSDKITVRRNDTNDRQALEARLRELKLTGYENCLVVSKGDRRAVLRLRGDLADFDYGNPLPTGYRPPRILAYKAEEALVQGVLSVTKGESPVIYFASGHGERDIDGDEDGDLGKWRKLLEEDGFDVRAWDSVQAASVPSDADVLALIGPRYALTDPELDAIKRYVDGGGRLIAAVAQQPEEIEASRVGELFAYFGLEVSFGLVCQPFADSAGNPRYADPKNALVHIVPTGMTRHAITSPLKDASRQIVLTWTHRVRVAPGGQPAGGASIPLLKTLPLTWMDIPPIDFIPDQLSEEDGPFDVAIASAFTPPDGPEDVPGLEARPQSRILALGSSDVMCNYWLDTNTDFVRNSFNWGVARDYRVSVSPRDPDERRLPLDAQVLAKLNRVCVWFLPGLCLALGVITALRRASGNPKQAA